MNHRAVTPDLLHQLVTGSHAEAITRLAVVAVIEHGERVLLIAQPGDDFDDSFQLPTDLVLPAEILTNAVHRVAAQAGIDIDHITSYLGHHELRTDDGDVLRVLGFAATTADPRPHLPPRPHRSQVGSRRQPPRRRQSPGRALHPRCRPHGWR